MLYPIVRTRKFSLASAIVLVLALASLGGLPGCSGAPQTEIDGARLDLQRAVSAEAEVYAAEAWQAASVASAALEEEIAEQEGKLAPFRRWGEARRLATDASAAAQHAVEQSALGKEAVRMETSQLIADVRSLIADVQQMLTTAPRGKGASTDLQLLQADLLVVEGLMTQAEQAYASESFTEAKTHAESARQTAQMIGTTIEKAIEMRTATGGTKPRS